MLPASLVGGGGASGCWSVVLGSSAKGVALSGGFWTSLFFVAALSLVSSFFVLLSSWLCPFRGRRVLPFCLSCAFSFSFSAFHYHRACLYLLF